MPRLSHWETLLHEGLRIVHERGFAGASVRDIVHAADVPQGSFTNHFASKEVFALEIIDLYLKSSRDVIRDTLHDLTRTPLARLAAYVDLNIARRSKNGVRHGCLLGNFAAEASEHSEAIRLRVVEIFAETQAAIASCLRDAVAAGELAAQTDCHELAGFIVSSLQGATLLGKAQRSGESERRFRQLLFSTVLIHPASASQPDDWKETSIT